MNTHGIMFHHFHNNIHIKGQGSISQSEFEQLIKWYSKKYKIIDANEYLEKVKLGKIKENEVCITFDDGLLCQFDIAYPVLKKMGITAFWFVYTSPLLGVYEKLEIYRHFRFYEFKEIDDFYQEFFDTVKNQEKSLGIEYDNAFCNFNIKEYKKNSPFYTENDKRFRFLRDEVLGKEKYDSIMNEMIARHNYPVEYWIKYLWMTQKQLEELHDNGHIIGLHSHTHFTSLNDYDYDKQYEEYRMCKSILEEIIGKTVEVVSYPCNAFNDDTTRIMEQLGMTLGFTATKNDSNGQLYLPREDHANILREMNYDK